jgi:multidrug efflux pump subunit AcrA (membrane-fusion protein)
MNYLQRWRKTTIANQAMVVATVLVAFGTLCLAVAAGFQYLTAREQSTAAREQAGTAKEQANVMQRQLNTMQDQANSMRAQTNTLNESLAETRKSVNAAEKQADTSEASAKAAQQSVQVAAESMRYGQAAYVTLQLATAGAFNVNAPVAASVKFFNSGQTPAYDVSFRGYMDFRNEPVPVPMPFPPLTNKQVASKGILPANTPVSHMFVMTAKLTEADLQIISRQEYKLYVWGQVTYRDIFKRNRWLRFCLVHKFGTGQFVPCENNNEAN